MIPLNLYKKIHEVLPIVCVDLVIQKGGHILLAKRLNRPVAGQWWFPGGRVKKGETLEQAAIRKVEEEVGLKLKKISKIGVEETIFLNDGPFGLTTHTVNIIFYAKIRNDGEIILDQQHSEFCWVSGVKKDFHPYIKKYIKQVNKQNG